MSITSYYANKLLNPVGVSTNQTPTGQFSSKVVDQPVQTTDPRNNGIAGMDTGSVNANTQGPASDAANVQITAPKQNVQPQQVTPEVTQEATTPVQPTTAPVQQETPATSQETASAPVQETPAAETAPTETTETEEERPITLVNKDDEGGDVELEDKNDPWQMARQNAVESNRKSQEKLLNAFGMNMEQINSTIAKNEDDLARLERKHRLERGNKAFWLALRHLANLAGVIAGAPNQEISNEDLEREQTEYERVRAKADALIDKYKASKDTVRKDYETARRKLEENQDAVIAKIDLAEGNAKERQAEQAQKAKDAADAQAQKVKDEAEKAEQAQKNKEKTLELQDKYKADEQKRKHGYDVDMQNRKVSGQIRVKQTPGANESGKGIDYNGKHYNDVVKAYYEAKKDFKEKASQFELLNANPNHDKMETFVLECDEIKELQKNKR